MRLEVRRQGAVVSGASTSGAGPPALRPALAGAAVALGAILLAGCDAMPFPEAALLKPQVAPKCEAPREPRGGGGARTASADASAGKGVATDEATRMRKLDYEAQCYRHAEMIARSRLGRLQDSVQDMRRAAKAPPVAPPAAAY